MGTVHAKEFDATLNFDSIENKDFDKDNMRSKQDIPFEEDLPAFFKGNNEDAKTADTMKLDLKNVKVRVDKVHVDGLVRTKDDVVKAQVQDLFQSSDFHEVIINAHKIRSKLEGLGCFKNIGVNIDASEGPDATPEGVEVTFKVKELKRMMGGINTLVGNNEASLLISAKAPNLLGRGERFQMEYSYGNHHTSNINLSVIKPFLMSKLSKTLTASIYNHSGEYPWSGYNQNDKGFLLDFAFDSNEIGTFRHNLQYEATIRDLSAIKTASFKVREQCGPTLKSAIRHICTVDKRDESLFPKTGTLVQCTTEVAGLGGNIGFIKNELFFQSNWTPHEYLTFQLGAQTGFLRGISNDMQINIADNFFLGGPMNLRGFNIRGVGPREDGDCLGGNSYWATALHFYTPLPFRPGKNSFGELFRLHGFINAGNVHDVKVNSGRSYEENLKILTENVRCAMGCGIAMKIGNIARVELNFCTPLKFLRNDVQQSIQLGLGIHYL